MEHFYRAQQNLSSLHKRGWRSAEKKSPVFFNMRVLYLDFYALYLRGIRSPQTKRSRRHAFRIYYLAIASRVFVLFWSANPCASPPPRPSIISDYSFLVHHPVSQDDQHLLALAKASDFTVTWQFSQREQPAECVMAKNPTFVFNQFKIHRTFKTSIFPESANRTSKIKSKYRIINGFAPKGNRPWLVFIKTGHGNGAGSILNKNFVLTAAHVVCPANADNCK
jgi:hypothetical protein